MNKEERKTVAEIIGMDGIEKLYTYNYCIEHCGIKYCAHTNMYGVYVTGNSWSLQIPIERIRDFILLFPNVEFEDGQFLEVLEGEYVRVITDGQLNIIALRNIVDFYTYWVEDIGEGKE